MEVLTNPWQDIFSWDDYADWGIVPLRLVLGYVFLYSGAKKFRGGIRGTGRWMEGLGLPAPYVLAFWTAALEVGGGLLLIVGLGTHWIAVPLAANMIGATFTQKFKLNAPFGGGEVQGYELDVVLAVGAGALILLGSGPASLDALIGR